VYATIERRQVNPDRLSEAAQRTDTKITPTLQQAPGFVAFYVIAGEDGRNAAVALWESRAQADAYQAALADWGRTLEELGHRLESETGGEVVYQILPRT
jgi:hypothetical protein